MTIDFEDGARRHDTVGEHCPIVPQIERMLIGGNIEPPPLALLIVGQHGLVAEYDEMPFEEVAPFELTGMFLVQMGRLLRKTGADRIWENGNPSINTRQEEGKPIRACVHFVFALEAREWDEGCPVLEYDYGCGNCGGSGEMGIGLRYRCARCGGTGNLPFTSSSRWLQGQEAPDRCVKCNDWRFAYDRLFTGFKRGEEGEADETIIRTRECIGCGAWEEIAIPGIPADAGGSP